MKYEVGMIGFVYPNPKSVFSSLISYTTEGYFSHCFQFVKVKKDDIQIAHAIFPNGVTIENLTRRMNGRAFDVMRIKNIIDEDRLIKWWHSHQNRKYDWLYYFGYIMKKTHIQNPFAYTCNEAIIAATQEAGVTLKGDSPVTLSKDKHLEYVTTIIT